MKRTICTLAFGCALALGMSACAGRTHIAAPSQGQTVSWFLRAGPRNGSQPIVCASDMRSPCLVNLTAAEKKPIEGTVVIAFPPTSGHTFKGEAMFGFMGDEERTGYTRTIEQGTDNKDPVMASTTGLVTRAGRYPMRITVAETGPDLQQPLHHNIEVTVTVQ